MSKYKKPNFTREDLGENAFLDYLEIPIRTIEFRNQYKKDSEGILVNVTAEVEQTPFTRLYVKPENNKKISAMPPSSKELFLWIMAEIKSGDDFIWINRVRFMQENKTSLNTYKKAIEGLVMNKVLNIAVVKGVYWINPKFFFKGNRIEKFPQNVVD